MFDNKFAALCLRVYHHHATAILFKQKHFSIVDTNHLC